MVTGNRQDDGFVVEQTSTRGWALIASFRQVQIRKLYIQGRSYREIAAIVGVSTSTVHKYLAPVTRGRLVNEPSENT